MTHLNVKEIQIKKNTFLERIFWEKSTSICPLFFRHLHWDHANNRYISHQNFSIQTSGKTLILWGWITTLEQKMIGITESAKIHSFCKQCLHKYLVFLNWQLMSALASLESLVRSTLFLNWRSWRQCLQNEWPLKSILLIFSWSSKYFIQNTNENISGFLPWNLL